MKIDLKEVRSKLQAHEDVLVDGGYLEMDMKEIYEYLRESSISEESTKSNLSDYLRSKEFEWQSFTKAYLESILGSPVHLEETADGWIRIFTI